MAPTPAITNSTTSSVQYPAQFSPGRYVIYHPDYAEPLNIKITWNRYGTIFYRVRFDVEFSPWFHRGLYVGERSSVAFWRHVYHRMNLRAHRTREIDSGTMQFEGDEYIY